MAVHLQQQNQKLENDMEVLRNNFASAASIWKKQASDFSSKYPGEKFGLTSQI